MAPATTNWFQPGDRPVRTSALSDSDSSKSTLEHDFEPGDHVFRWSQIVLYPIQIHGIVLSSTPEAVTIIDFGLSTKSHTETTHLDDWRNSDDKRLNLTTITTNKELRTWKKVNYGGSLVSEGKWAKIISWFQRFKSDPKRSQTRDKDLQAKGTGECYKNHLSRTSSIDTQSRCSFSSEPAPAPPEEAFLSGRRETQEFLEWLESEDNHVADPESERSHNNENDVGVTEVAGQTTTGGSAPTLPKSDPALIVLSRVRFLLGNGKNAMPAHNILFANSECIAVWCKTGRFSTIQSQIFLHSAAIGNAKTTTTVALIVGSQTVTVSSTVPAAGFWGWLGYTTTATSQVGLLSLNPWLIPVIVGTGLAAVGTPYLVLHQAQSRWSEATEKLNDTYWQNATPDIFVEAIQNWSGLRILSS